MTMGVCLATLTETDAELTARWRESVRATLRTPYVQSVEEQRQFIRSLSARRHEYRYWAVATANGTTVGIAGLSPIQWENGLAEISLVLNPECVGKGYAEEAFALLLTEAFDNLRLEQVVVESYYTNPALSFWEEQAVGHGAYRTILPKRKYWNGAYHDAIYFSFSARKNGGKG